jgi:hypothetical protein
MVTARGYEPTRSLSVTSLGVSGFIGTDVDRFEGTAGAGDELLDLQLGPGEQRGAALVEGDAALVEGDRALEGLAAGLELGDGFLELGEGVVERQLRHRDLVRLRHDSPPPLDARSAVAGNSPRATRMESFDPGAAGSRTMMPSGELRTIA